MYLYKTSTTSCESQLSKDFGEYPPRPLNAKIKNHSFDIIKLSRIGGTYFTLSRCLRIFKRSPDQEAPIDVRSALHQFIKSKNELLESMTETKNMFRDFSLIQKILLLLVVILFSPFVLIVALFFLLRIFYLILRMPKIGTDSLGFFSPITQDKSEIVVKPAHINKSDLSLDAVVSHEHIHLMQHAAFKNRSTLWRNEDYKENLKPLIKSEYFDSESTFYHLSLNEVEARLHELVLSYYREFRALPVDYVGFLRLIVSVEEYGPLISNLLTRFDVALPEGIVSIYKSSAKRPIEDIFANLANFSELKTSVRYVCEALSVMYGNLMILYGAPDAAAEYFETIECCDLYNQIYGDIAYLSS